MDMMDREAQARERERETKSILKRREEILPLYKTRES